jgi:hypothetical protein
MPSAPNHSTAGSNSEIRFPANRSAPTQPQQRSRPRRLTCSGSSKIATSWSAAGMAAVMSPTGRMDPRVVKYLPGKFKWLVGRSVG